MEALVSMEEKEWTTGREVAPVQTTDDYDDTEIVVSVPMVVGEQDDIPALYEIDKNYVVQLFPTEDIERLPRNQKHGFAASVPMICKKEDCPFFKVCSLRDQVDEMMERCAVEMEYIMQAFTMYMRQLKVPVDDLVNMVGIKILISLDLRIERLNKWQQLNPGLDFVEQITGVTEGGDLLSRIEEHPVNSLLPKLIDKREKMLDSMMGTKKSRRATKQLSHGGSRRAQQLMEERRRRIELERNQVENREG